MIDGYFLCYLKKKVSCLNSFSIYATYWLQIIILGLQQGYVLRFVIRAWEVGQKIERTDTLSTGF